MKFFVHDLSVPLQKCASIMLTLFLFIALTVTGFSQEQKILKGVVKDANTNEPLIGVNIQIKGKNTGAVTDIDGNFELQVETQDTLTASYIGYMDQEILTDNVSFVNLLLYNDNVALDEVTVTALGIKRATKSLGYAVQEIDGGELTTVKDPNLINNLAGKAAGVNIIGGGSGVGASSRIVIRGESSLSGNNQPLFVVNGIPINNSGGGNGRTQGNLEADYGNGAGEINPEDIETLTVLKGANATALYGSRAANGVILITTKSGAGKQGVGIDVNLSSTFENPLRIPQYQNKYGQGAGFNFEFVDGFGSGTNDNIDESWGPALDGRMMVQHHSKNGQGIRAGDFRLRPADYSDQSGYEQLPWSPQPDNIKNFFETGVTTNANIAVYGGDDKRNFRLSYTNLNSEGILPNTNLKRNTINLDATQYFFNKKLAINTNVNYVNSGSDNRTNNSYGTENVMYLWVWFGRHIPMNTLSDYWQRGLEGIQQFNYNYNWHDNPYFTLFENTNAFDKDRIYGNINATYNITDDLSLMLRTGTDFYNELRVGKRAWSTQRFDKGQYREDKIFWRERNTDFLLNYNTAFDNKLSLNASMGGNQMSQTYKYDLISANELAVPGVYTFANSAVALSKDPFRSEKRINSLYASASLGINNGIYIDLAGRNDWASTLPSANNSYFYPSASVSFILDELLDLPKGVSFAKLRVGWGQVGNDTDPYGLDSYFEFLSTPYGTQLLGTESNNLANPDLKPERASTFEVGADLRLFKNRFGLDIAYYNTNTINQILRIPVSQTSGYGSKLINAGEITSQGVEGLLSITPVKSRNFTWDSNINFTLNRSKVIELAEGLETYSISSNYLQTLAKVGGRMGDVYGTGFVLVDPNKNERVTVDDIEDIQDGWGHLYNSDGLPIRDPNLRRLGNYNPDFTVGFSNSFNFKGFNVGFLLDWRQGGVVLSRTLLIGGTSGMMEETAQYDRERHQFIGGQTKVNGVSTLDRPGFIEVSTDNGSGPVTYTPNNIPVSARDFYWSHFNRGNEEVGLYDATFVKLREARIGYTLPVELSKKIGAQKLTISVVGRNLALWTENPHFDPEVFSYDGNTIVPGVEDMATPSSRSIGASLNITF